MIDEFPTLSNSELQELISEWVKSEQIRKIMKRRLIDGIKFEPLAEEFEMSERQMRKIVQKHKKILLSKTNPE